MTKKELLCIKDSLSRQKLYKALDGIEFLEEENKQLAKRICELQSDLSREKVLHEQLKEHCDELELINQKVMEENEQLKQQIEQLQKINQEQKETLKKVRVALIQERTANIINYGKGGVEMFDNIFEVLSGVSN